MEGSVHQLNQHDLVVPEVMIFHREEGVFPFRVITQTLTVQKQ